MEKEKGLVSAGAGIVFRHQRILWWVFGINFVLGAIASMLPRSLFSPALGRSLAASKISGNFDLVAFVELLMRPDFTLAPAVGGSVALQLVFFAFLLFVTGGILTVYREDRRLTTAEFFEACGLYVWRFVRLLLFSLVPLALVAAFYAIVSAIAGKVGENTAYESHAFYVSVAGLFVAAVLALFVRLWFDVAQVRAVAQNERRMWSNMWRALVISVKALGTLLWMYFRISLVAWVVLIVGIWLWLRIPGQHFGISWLLLEVVLLVQIAVRLWQRASAITWYKRYAEEHPALAVEFTTPAPVMVEGTSVTPAEPIEPTSANAPSETTPTQQ